MKMTLINLKFGTINYQVIISIVHCAQMEEGIWLHVIVAMMFLIVGFVTQVIQILICYIIIQDVVFLSVTMIMEHTKIYKLYQ